MTARRNKASVVMLTDDGGSKDKVAIPVFSRPWVRSRGELFYCTTDNAIYFAREDQRADAAFLAMERRSFGSRLAALTFPPFAPRMRRAAVAGWSEAGLESFPLSPTATATMKLASSFVSRGRLGLVGIPYRCHGSRARSSDSVGSSTSN